MQPLKKKKCNRQSNPWIASHLPWKWKVESPNHPHPNDPLFSVASWNFEALSFCLQISCNPDGAPMHCCQSSQVQVTSMLFTFIHFSNINISVQLLNEFIKSTSLFFSIYATWYTLQIGIWDKWDNMGGKTQRFRNRSMISLEPQLIQERLQWVELASRSMPDL